MSKKTLIIIIASVLILVVIGVAVFFFTQKKDTPAGETTDSGGFFSSLFPSSENRPAGTLPTPTLAPNTGTGGETNFGAIEGQSERNLIQLTNFAVAGAIFNKDRQKVYFFEKSTGHLYEISDQGTEKNPLSITTIPKIQEVLWYQTGSTTKAILRYTNPESGNELYNFISEKLVTDTSAIEGVFLDFDTTSAAISPLGEIFYLSGMDGSTGIKTDFKNVSKKVIFTSPFSDFIVSWPQANIITFLTKPTFSAEGYFYALDVKTQALTKIIGETKGLTASYAPKGSKILFSESAGKSFSAKIYDEKNKTTIDFTYKTLPEKCIWSNMDENRLYCSVPKTIQGGDYPDDWYKGNISFEDNLWQIDLTTGATKLLLDRGGFDIVNIFTNDTEDYVFFQNKKDGTLWSLKLPQDR